MDQTKMSITNDKEFRTLRELKEFLATLDEEQLDKDLINDGYRDCLSFYEDSDNKTIWYQ